MATVYNTLPSLEEADTHFNDRGILKKLINLFAYYPAYGVCLVHRHCTLEDGERMIAYPSDDPAYVTITRPSKDVDGYPHAWLIDGTPFEFSTTEVPELPHKLFEEFNKAVDNGKNTWNGRSVLGICYIGSSTPEGAHTDRTGSIPEWIEITLGRKNYLRRATEDDLQSENTIQTCWCAKLADQGHIERCACVCVATTTGHKKYPCMLSPNQIRYNSAE